MNQIYQETLERVQEGARVRVDFKTKTLTVGKTKVIDQGQYEGELGVGPMMIADVIAEMESMYARYRDSIPSERTDRQRRVYFKALEEHEISDEDMLFGDRRDFAQARLETFILVCMLNGNLTWDLIADEKMWFWQSQSHPSLVLLKEWF